MIRRSFQRAAFALAVAACLGTTTAMAAWPDKPITIVVPYAPGGTADALSRLIGQYLGPKLNTSVVVVNRAGASGVIGSASVAQAPADGYTVLYDATPLSINPHLLQKMPFDAQKDLAPVTIVAVTPMLVTVNKNSPHNSLQDLVKAGKAAPGKITFGSGGQGTVQYMAAELFNQATGMKMLHVAYKSGGPALAAALAGEVDTGFGNLPALSAQVKSGMLRPLAITSAQRHPLYPDVPTISEAAVKGYEAYEWNGMFLPAGTPADIVNKLNAALREVLANPEVKAKIEGLGSRIVASSPDEARKFFAADLVKWGQTVKAAGIQKE